MQNFQKFLVGRKDSLRSIGLNKVQQNSLLQVLSKPLYSWVLLSDYVNIYTSQIQMDSNFFCIEHLREMYSVGIIHKANCNILEFICRYGFP